MSSERITSKTLSRKTVLDHLQLYYSFPLPQVFNLLEGGTSSAVWKYVDGENKWMIKVFGLDEGPVERVNDEAKLFRYLNDCGIHVPSLLPDKDGNDVSSLNFHDNDFAIIVMKYEDLRMATPLTITRDEIIRIVTDIAKMHQVLRNYPGLTSLLGTAPREERETLARAFESVQATSSIREFSARQLRQFNQADLRMHTYLNANPEPKTLTHSLIHSDLSLEHAQFLPDNNVYFFDFSDRKLGAVIEELATFIACLYQWEDISFDRWEQLKGWVLDSYQSTGSLTSTDLSCMNRFIVIRLLEATKLIAQLFSDKPNIDADNWIRRGYQLGEYLTKDN